MAVKKPPVLFKECYFGMSKEAVITAYGAVSCPDAPDNPLDMCAPGPVSYLMQDWREMFSFNNWNELQQVILSGAKREDLPKVEEGLFAAGWQPVFIETDDDAFDALEAIKTQGAAEAVKMQKSFEEAALKANSGMTIYYFPATAMKRAVKNEKIRDYTQALDSAPENLRQASIMLTRDGLSLAFTAPLLSRKNALRYGQIIKRK